MRLHENLVKICKFYTKSTRWNAHYFFNSIYIAQDKFTKARQNKTVVKINTRTKIRDKDFDKFNFFIILKSLQMKPTFN